MNWSKFLVVAGFIAILVGAFFIWKIEHDIAAKQDNIEKSIVEMKQLGDGIVRAQAGFATKDDIANLGKDVDLKKIQDDLAELHAKIEGIEVVVTSTPGYVGKGLSSTTTIPNANPNLPVCPNGDTCPDPFGYLSNAQVLALGEPMSDGSSVPIGKTTFKSWEAHPWDLEIYPRQYKISNVLGEDENGRHYVYNKFSITTNGTTYTIPIQQAEFKEVYPDPSFSFNPRLYLGVGVGAVTGPMHAEVAPSLQVSLFSYGKTKIDPDWSFAGVGVAYESQSKRPAIVISPVNYNVAHHLPLVHNLQVGPQVSVDTNGSFGIYGAVQVGL